MSRTVKRINIAIAVEEWEALTAHCERFSRNKTEVMRELIRSLPEYQELVGQATDGNGGGAPSEENQG